jgi:hypothetical protein
MTPVGEGRRALIASALGVVLGLIAVVFARREASTRAKEGRRWRGRSAT